MPKNAKTVAKPMPVAQPVSKKTKKPKPVESANSSSMAAEEAAILAYLTSPSTQGVESVRCTLRGVSVPTACVTAKHTIDLDPDECADGFQFFSFRKPGKSAVISCAPKSGVSWRYDALIVAQPAPANAKPVAIQSSAIIAANQVGEVFPIISTLWSTDDVSYDKHKAECVSLSSKIYPDRSFIYLDGGEQINYQGHLSAAGAVTLKARLYNGGNLNYAQSDTQTLGAAGDFVCNMSIPNSEAGYYTFEYEVSTAVTLSSLRLWFSGSDVTVPKIHRQICMNGYCPQAGNLPRGVVTTSDTVIKNGTPQLYLGGTVVGANLNAGKMWTDYDSYQAIAGIRDRYEDVAKEGAQSHLVIADEDTDLSNKDLVRTAGTSGTVLRCLETLEEDSDWYAISFSLPSGGNQQFSIVICDGAEFIADTPFIETRFGTSDPQAWRNAIAKLRVIPQFTPNAVHWKEISKAIKDVARKSVSAVVKYGPAAISFAQKAATLLG